MAVMTLMADLGAKAENVIVAQFVRLGVAERVRRLSLLHEEIVASENDKAAKDEQEKQNKGECSATVSSTDDSATPKSKTAESEREGDVVFPTEKDVSCMYP